MEDLPLFIVGAIVTALVVVAMLRLARAQVEEMTGPASGRVAGDVSASDPRRDSRRDSSGRGAAGATSRSRPRATRGSRSP